MATRETIKDPHEGFRIMGYIDTEDNGDKTARDHFFKPLGFYTKSTNITKSLDFTPITIGDTTMSLVTTAYYKWLDKEKNRNKR